MAYDNKVISQNVASAIYRNRSTELSAVMRAHIQRGNHLGLTHESSINNSQRFNRKSLASNPLLKPNFVERYIITNNHTSWLLSRLCFRRAADTGTGFVAIKREGERIADVHTSM